MYQLYITIPTTVPHYVARVKQSAERFAQAAGTALRQRGTKMNAINKGPDGERYARCIQTSKRVRWDIDEDVIRGRRFDVAHKFLPNGLSLADAFTTLSTYEKRLVSQIQGRTYANVFGLVERFINAKVLELSEDHWFGDQIALEALVRFSDEELKHQALFRRIDAMVGAARWLSLRRRPQ